MPGFIEGHGHFTGIGEGKLNLELMNTKSWDEIVHMVAARRREGASRASGSSAAAGTRRSGRPRRSRTSKGFPTHESLDKVSPNNPVILTHASGHASFANAKAMELSNITAATANPNGGEILKDAKGQPTGLLRETASGLIRRGAGAPTPTAERNRGARTPRPRAGGSRGDLEGHHELSGRRVVVRQSSIASSARSTPAG